MKTIGLISIVAMAMLAAAGCGGSQPAADKAKSQACDAGSDAAFKTQVQQIADSITSTHVQC